MYAVIKAGGKQYTVREGDSFAVNKLEGAQGDNIALDVLALGSDAGLITDAAALAKASVSAVIAKQGKDEKVIVFKKKRRQKYRRKLGHRQMISTIEITSISADGAKAADKKVAAKSEAKEDKKEAKPAAKPEAKASPKKEAAKPSEAKKAPAKKAASKKEAAPKKPAAKKPAAKKTAAKKQDK